MKKYLALGDSYTIGEQIDYSQNFPSQLVQALNARHADYFLDKLVAVTGWTTSELAAALAKEKPSAIYDLVTLLIGVNNQYRGLTLSEYEWQFYALLCQAILFAKGEPGKVYVLSIPDWGLTPFNKDRDKNIITSEIDAYNKIVKETSLSMGCHFVDITGSTRLHAEDPDYLAPDGLHYAAKEYSVWVEKILSQMNNP